MLDENLEDAGLILRGILMQPLSLDEISDDSISLLTACEDYIANENTDLEKVIHSFLRYPGPTETLIKELKIISNDLA